MLVSRDIPKIPDIVKYTVYNSISILLYYKQSQRKEFESGQVITKGGGGGGGGEGGGVI